MKKPVVLVVEDDDQTAVFIRHFLEQEGYEVRQAADGKEALEVIASMPPPALVTLDIDLPHARGDDLMMQIKTTAGWERVPVIMVTATPKSVDTTWAVRTGAKAYLVKPFKPEDLLATVRKLTAKSA
jgi:twitching motility two-component system response regulator PilH